MTKLALTLDNLATKSQPFAVAADGRNGREKFSDSLRTAEITAAQSESTRTEAADTSRRSSTTDRETNRIDRESHSAEEAADQAQGSSDDAQALPDRSKSDEADVSLVGEGAKEGTEQVEQADVAKQAEVGSARAVEADVRSKVSRGNETQSGDRRQAARQASENERQQQRTESRSDSTQDSSHSPASGQRIEEQPKQDDSKPIEKRSEAQPVPRDQLEQELGSRQRVDAAIARAAQVETAIRLESATGQSASSGDAAARPGMVSLQGGAAISGNGVNNGGESPTQLPTPNSPVDDERFSSRIVRGLTAMVNQRGGSMTMRLDPPELGQLRVQMTITRGVVTAQFTATTPQAHALLEKNMATLRVALENQGLTVERLNVSSSQSGSSQQQAMNDQTSERNQQHHRHDAGGEHSRGRREQPERETASRRGVSFAGLVADLHENTGADAA